MATRALALTFQKIPPVALVTGGSQGIGQAVATTFAQAGFNVWLTSRDAAKAAAVAAALPYVSATQVHTGVRCDVTVEADIKLVAQTIGDEIGVLVNCAGIAQDSLAARLDSAAVESQLRTNLTAPILFAREICKPMIRQRSGVIINVGSVVGRRGHVGQAAYSASKAGLVGLTASLAKELGAKGIRVVCVEPGYIETQMTAGLTNMDNIKKATPLGRIGTPADVAQLVAFLASDSASYITGCSIAVDGGLVL